MLKPKNNINMNTLLYKSLIKIDEINRIFGFFKILNNF